MIGILGYENRVIDEILVEEIKGSYKRIPNFGNAPES